MMTERITLKLGRDASDLSTTSDSVQMSHTGSEGVLSLPDPPLAGNIPSTVTRAGGIAPSPLVTTSSQSEEEMVTPFFKADPLEDEEEDSEDEDIYELLSDEFDAARLQESTNLLPGRASLEAGEQDSARSGMQNVAVVKRERTAIQVLKPQNRCLKFSLSCLKEKECSQSVLIENYPFFWRLNNRFCYFTDHHFCQLDQ